MSTLLDHAKDRHAKGKMLGGRLDGVGLLVFNQPEKRNAMSVEMWDGMVEILEDFVNAETRFTGPIRLIRFEI